MPAPDAVRDEGYNEKRYDGDVKEWRMVHAPRKSAERGIDAVQDTDHKEEDGRDNQSNCRVKRASRLRRLCSLR